MEDGWKARSLGCESQLHLYLSDLWQVTAHPCACFLLLNMEVIIPGLSTPRGSCEFPKGAPGCKYSSQLQAR